MVADYNTTPVQWGPIPRLLYVIGKSALQIKQTFILKNH